MHLEMIPFVYQTGDLACRIIEVAELNGGGNTRRCANRRDFEINARFKPNGQSLINPVDAESAFLGNAKAIFMGDGFFLDGLLAVIIFLFMNDGPRLIGASDSARGATDAAIIVHGDQPVFTLFGGAGGADGNAGWLIAMLAANHHEKTLHIGKFTGFNIQYFAPLYAGYSVIGVFAGDSAGLTADATVNIDGHTPSFFTYFIHAGDALSTCRSDRFEPEPLVTLIRA